MNGGEKRSDKKGDETSVRKFDRVLKKINSFLGKRVKVLEIDLSDKTTFFASATVQISRSTFVATRLFFGSLG